MENTELFTAALGLTEPWEVVTVEFMENEKTHTQELHIQIDFTQGAHFSCPKKDCNQDLPVHDTKNRTWRHMNFFQYKCFIHARVPRVICPDHKVHVVAVPWGRPGSGFTLLMEAYLIQMVSLLSVRAVSRMIDEHDTKLWRLLQYYGEDARKRQDFSQVEALGVDEYSHKGHNYITIFMDHNQGNAQVLYCTKGKAKATVTAFTSYFNKPAGKPEKVRVVTCDMAHGYRNAMKEVFTEAVTIVDKFHVIKYVNDAVDLVRRKEVSEHRELCKTRYIRLKNPQNLTEKQQVVLEELKSRSLKTFTAYQMRLVLQDIYRYSPHRERANLALKALCDWMAEADIYDMKRMGRMLKRNREDILNYFDLKYTNAILEGMNSIISLVKRRVRGYRNLDYFMTMIYLDCSKLKLKTVPLC